MSQEVKSTSEPSMFDAAKVIAEQLRNLPDDQRSIAVKFACESLGVQPSALGHSGATAPASTATVPAPAVAGSSQDIKQFVASKAPQSDVQFAAVVAHYFRFTAPEAERKEGITVEDLAQAARLAGRPVPPRHCLSDARAMGYLDTGPARGVFVINRVGENLVAVTMGADACSDTRSGQRPREAAARPRRRPQRRQERMVARH